MSDINWSSITENFVFFFFLSAVVVTCGWAPNCSDTPEKAMEELTKPTPLEKRMNPPPTETE